MRIAFKFNGGDIDQMVWDNTSQIVLAIEYLLASAKQVNSILWVNKI
jgi:hypothetical protein